MYLRARPTLSGCGCGCSGKGGCAPTATGHDGLSGDDSADAVRFLQAQLNRFVVGATTSPGMAVFPIAVGVTGNLDAETAKRALTIGIHRASEGGDSAGIVRYSKALPAAQTFVAQNLAELAETVKIYGDLHGVPAAKSVGFAFPTWGVAAIVTVGVVGAFWAFRKAFRSR